MAGDFVQRSQHPPCSTSGVVCRDASPAPIAFTLASGTLGTRIVVIARLDCFGHSSIEFADLAPGPNVVRAARGSTRSLPAPIRREPLPIDLPNLMQNGVVYR